LSFFASGFDVDECHRLFPANGDWIDTVKALLECHLLT
jgi:hypothetical protein